MPQGILFQMKPWTAPSVHTVDNKTTIFQRSNPDFLFLAFFGVIFDSGTQILYADPDPRAFPKCGQQQKIPQLFSFFVEFFISFEIALHSQKWRVISDSREFLK